MRSPVTYFVLGLVGFLLMSLVSIGSAPLASAYTPHDPILITDNSMFDADHGVTSGTGTALDPYIIENWEITNTSGVNAIDIENTTAFFIIKNCSIKVSTVWCGVYFLGVTNGGVVGNSFYTATPGAGYGILIVDSPNNTITSNTIENTNWGIYVSNSDFNIVTTNTVTNVGAYGIFLYSHADNNFVGNNTSNYNKWGILLYKYCEGNELINNICEHNATYGIGLYDNCDYNILTGNVCTTDGIFIDSTSVNNILSGNMPPEGVTYVSPELPGAVELPDVELSSGVSGLVSLFTPFTSGDPVTAGYLVGIFFFIAPLTIIGLAVVAASKATQYGGMLVMGFFMLGMFICVVTGLFPWWFLVTIVAIIALILSRGWFGRE